MTMDDHAHIQRAISNGVHIKKKLTVKSQKLQGALAGSGSSTQEALLGLLAGAVFGMVSPVIGHPFDLVKTQMQTMPELKTTSVLQSVRYIYVKDGIRGFYRGFIPPLLGSIAFRGVQFGTYASTYACCCQYPLLASDIPYTGGLRMNVLVGAWVAAGARSVIETPLEFIKVRVMVGKSALEGAEGATSSLTSSLRNMSKTPLSSFRHMYQGFTPTLYRTLGLFTSFFVLVDYSVRYIPDVINAPLIGPFFKGGICATLAWTLAFPMETAKSVIQSDSTGKYKSMRYSTWVVMKQIYSERGVVKGLYRGFAPGAGRSFVANGVSMIVYSWFQDAFRSG